MDEAQTSTAGLSDQVKELNFEPEKLLKAQQEQWIAFCALGGLITLESDDRTRPQDIKQMTITEFSEIMNIPRRTLYNWKKSIPNFSERVRAKRYEVFSLSRETTLFNRAYLVALTSNDHRAVIEAIQMLLGHFSKLDLPVQRQEIDAGQNLIDLVNTARKKKIIEGEISESASNA